MWSSFLYERRGAPEPLAWSRAQAVLDAERHQAERLVYAAHLEEVQGDEAVYALDLDADHPVWGPMERPDARELERELKEASALQPQLSVTFQPDVWWQRRGKFACYFLGSHHDARDRVVLRMPPSFEKPPEHAWVMPFDAGSWTLGRRKADLTTLALARKHVAQFISDPSDRGDVSPITDQVEREGPGIHT